MRDRGIDGHHKVESRYQCGSIDKVYEMVRNIENIAVTA